MAIKPAINRGVEYKSPKKYRNYKNSYKNYNILNKNAHNSTTNAVTSQKPYYH